MGSGGVFRSLPIDIDIDTYAYAILHTVDFFEAKRRTTIKWDDKEIKRLEEFYPLANQTHLNATVEEE